MAVGDTDILKPEAFVGMRKLDSGWDLQTVGTANKLAATGAAETGENL